MATCLINWCTSNAMPGKDFCSRHNFLNDSSKPKKPKEKKEKSNKINDKVLWKWFSLFIRLRDTDKRGYGKCFTCPRIIFYKQGDCGHGIPRQHLSVKYSEKNNHLQCKPCNGFEGGKREVYKEAVNNRYGQQTWQLLEIMSKKPSKIGQFEIDRLAIHYKREVEKLLATKEID